MKTESKTFHFIQFDEDNEFRFYMDHAWWKNIPSDVKFLVVDINKDSIEFLGDGYGVSDRHRLQGIVGSYGSGSIHVLKSWLPIDIVKWCEEHVTPLPKNRN